MNIKSHLRYVKKVWDIFPTYTLYPTSKEKSIIPDEVVYVYSLHKVKQPIYEEYIIQSSCFRLFIFHVKDIKEPTGYCIIPTLPNGYIIRYTPLAIVATNPEATKEAIKASEREVVYKTSSIEFLRMSCGVEIVTDIGHRLDIYLGKEK